MSVVPPDLFAGMDGVTTDIPDAPDDPAPVIEEPPAAIEEPVVQDPAPVEDAPVADAPAADETAEAVAADPADADLPEGISRAKDSSGKYKYSLDENRYEKIYGNHKLVQEFRAALGGQEPTIEGLKIRNDAYLERQRMFAGLESGDPAEQGEVLNFIFDEMRAAHNAGEVGVDPTVPFAQTFYDNIREQSPEGFAEIRYLGARDLIGEMFHAAAESGNQQLYSAAQHFSMAISGVKPKPEGWTNAQYLQHISEVTEQAGIPFYGPGGMQELARGVDPLQTATARIRELEQQINGGATNPAEEAYKAWNKTHISEVNAAIDKDGISPELAPIATAWKDFPDDYGRLVLEPLKAGVIRIIRGDKVLATDALVLQKKAARAASPDVRQYIGEQIKQLYVNRAKLAFGEVKGPILATAAKTLKGLSDQVHARHAGAQGRTTPRGTSTPVRQSVAPVTSAFPNGTYDPKIAFKQAQEAISAIR